jgi:sugar/nucleoside kinase (ribokinase family)
VKKFQVATFGNAIVDILIELTNNDPQVESLGLKNGSFQLVELDFQKKIIENYKNLQPKLVSGGAIANSVIAFSQLGGKASFTACIGDDRYGLHYKSEFEELGIHLGLAPLKNESSGTCVILVSPNAERTMCTNLACAALLGSEHINENLIKDSEWIFTEGYLLAVPAGMEASYKLVELAKKNQTKLAFTLSAEFIVSAFKEPVTRMIKNADLIFANIHEAELFAGVKGAELARKALKELCQHVVITDGENGVWIAEAGKDYHVPAIPTKPIDLTGAGDMFAGAYMYGITHGLNVEEAGRKACFLAHKVIQQVGARVTQGLKEDWNKA